MSEFNSCLAPYIEEYCRWCTSTGILPDRAKAAIKNFDHFCNTNYPQMESLLQEAVDIWFKKKDIEKINSCRSRIYPVIAFLKYTNNHGYTDVIIPTPPKKQPRTYIPHEFTDDELKQFFYYADHMEFDKNNLQSVKNKMTFPVIFRLLYSTGMRPCEARWLTAEDIDLQHGIINIRKSKCSIEHYVCLHESMRDILERYNNTIEKLYPERKYFFPGEDGKCLTSEWVNYYFRPIWAKVTNEYANPYALRHNYAIRNINSWIGDKYTFFDKFVYLSKSMGHVTLESTRYYYSLVPGLADIIERLENDNFNELVPEVEDGEDQL